MIERLYKFFGSRQCLHCGSWQTTILAWGGSYFPELKQAINTSEQRICNMCDERMYISIKKVDPITGDVLD